MAVINKIEFPGSDKLIVRVGDEFEFTDCTQGRDGSTFHKGTRLKVVDKTTKTPHNELGPNGVNFICETEANGRTVWSSVEWLMALRIIVKVDPKPEWIVKVTLTGFVENKAALLEAFRYAGYISTPREPEHADYDFKMHCPDPKEDTREWAGRVSYRMSQYGFKATMEEVKK